MALTTTARKKLLKLVQDAKKCLYQEIIDQLQQYYGIFPDTGKVLLVEQLTTNDADVLYNAKLLRDRLKYLSTNLADKKNVAVESINQLIREQAFTILNRLAALRMAEERGIIKETIRNSYSSEGFQVFDSITGQGAVASTFERYKWYLNAIYDELAIDLPSIFDRFSPYAIITPDEKSLLVLISLINDEGLSLHREDGFPPVNLWQQDETIGWIYQYYNGKDEIKAMRDASALPRNSRELAVRNQFFTPRYVVQFLTDNSLGKIWYEMTKGNTRLKELCPYLIKNPNTVFLNKGELPPVSPEKEITHIEHREIKDPREIKMLDPACGSMHFGLYAFDLFEIIYLEAWDNHTELLTDLKNTMTRTDFINQIPEFIIRYNIHGVDIDPRALQIAALSLWLRAQKSFDKLGLDASNRPKITKSNLVLAEPMPGNADFLNEIVKPLDAPMRKLVLDIWGLMKIAGETGLLLKIENEIDLKIQEIAKELVDKNADSQIEIETTDNQLIEVKESVRYATKEYRTEFLNNAENQVLNILKSLAEEATNGEAYQKLLFADDSARGFAFIELCLQCYDVVLMNPPFGDASVNTESYLQKNYPNWGKNILTAFFYRTLDLINDSGFVASIFDRSVAIKSSFEQFRKDSFCGYISSMADTGWNVLDANVETTTLVLRKKINNHKAIFINLTEISDKENELIKSISDFNSFITNINIFIKNSYSFLTLPNSIIGYYLENQTLDLFNQFDSLEKNDYYAMYGSSISPEQYLRTFYELDLNNNFNKFVPYYLGGGMYTMFYCPFREMVLWGEDGYLVKYGKSNNLRNVDSAFHRSVGYGKRGEITDAHILPDNILFSAEGHAFNLQGINNENIFCLLSFLNSIYSQFIINQYCGQHKTNGYINLIPFPNIDNEDVDIFSELSQSIIQIKRKWYSIDETCLDFRHLIFLFTKNSTIYKSINDINFQINSDKEIYNNLLKLNDSLWIEKAQISSNDIETYEQYKLKRQKENLISLDFVNDDNFINNRFVIFEIISNLLGVAFGRWDIRSIINPELIPAFGDIFDPLPFMPAVSLKEVPKDYPISIPSDGILVDDITNPNSITKSISNVIYKIWNSNRDNIIDELCEIGQIKSIEDFMSNPNGFFDFHYKRYTKSRRVAPIYWPISTVSGSYTIWLYYPKLTEQTLISVINNYLQPKIDDVVDNIRTLSGNSNLDNKGLKELKELEDLEHELEEMKKELQAISALPYKPNHDDGVLITAAPLHKLFRHSKWRKSTEECWKSLGKGDYDWAHLAYSIWPDRVRRKCKKDLSMAIAHGLEDICEIKPKEKKVKIKKEPREIKTDLKINFDV